jgi:hypothetical protein
MANQFGSFDGLDNRKEIMAMLRHLGMKGGSAACRGSERAAFLRNLVGQSESGFALAPVEIPALSLVEAYFAFTAITGVLGVPIEEAAKALEAEVRK